jgi:type IV pilus assembly protein PilA
MTKFFRSSKGFSLIELMIVVAIIAILAAIAIPSFLRFQMKSKTSEATANLGAIRTCEESYKAENDTYLDQGPAPAAAGLDSQTHVWDPLVDLPTFEAIGYAPDGPTRYQYAVTGSGVTTFVATATGNLDDDAAQCIFTVDKSDVDYPKAIKSGDDF